MSRKTSFGQPNNIQSILHIIFIIVHYTYYIMLKEKKKFHLFTWKLVSLNNSIYAIKYTLRKLLNYLYVYCMIWKNEYITLIKAL